MFLILVLNVFDNEPKRAAVAKAVGIEYVNPIPFNATYVEVAVVPIDDNSISLILAMLIKFLYLLNFWL